MAVTLTFPADTSSIRLARLVASGFASQLGATVADLDDLRTMVDELCSMLVAQSEQGDEITVRLDSDGAIVHATATATSCPRASCGSWPTTTRPNVATASSRSWSTRT